MATKSSKKRSTVKKPREDGLERLPLSKPYCVIGKMIHNSTALNRTAVGRTYMETMQEAVDHAVELIDNPLCHQSELYVVKVVRVIRRKPNHEVLKVY